MDRRGPFNRMDRGDGYALPRDREMMRERDIGRDREYRERDRQRDMGPPPPDYGVPRNFGRPMRPPPMMGRQDPYGPRDAFPGRPHQPDFVIDREKTCPLLLRVWVKTGGHHKLEDFAICGKEPAGDIQVYTWMDASLRELSDLIKEVVPETRKANARMSFSLIYPNKNGVNKIRDLGQVHSTRQANDDNRTLRELKFQTGDFMDVAVWAL